MQPVGHNGFRREGDGRAVVRVVLVEVQVIELPRLVVVAPMFLYHDQCIAEEERAFKGLQNGTEHTFI